MKVDPYLVAFEFQELTDSNNHTEATALLVQIYGNDEENKEIINIQERHDHRGFIKDADLNRRDELLGKYFPYIRGFKRFSSAV